jgi:hypothetical protein
MKTVHAIFIVFMPIIFSCQEKSEVTGLESAAPKENIPKTWPYKNKNSAERQPYIEQVDHFIFGVYCGECSGECATMYRYNMGGNAHTLQVDHTDSFFKQPREVNCSTPVNDGAKIRLAGEVIDYIPLEILQATEGKRYGCPDCTDGCGVYFELGMGQQVHRFYLDPHDRNLNQEIKDFTQFLMARTNKLESKTP